MTKGSAAQQAGLQRGDVILKVNGQTAGADNLYFLFAPGANKLEACRQGATTLRTLQYPETAK